MATKRKKMNVKSRKSRTKGLSIRIGVISSITLFKSIILLATLTVAMVAIYNNVYDTKVWTFLSSMLMYAALTNGQGGHTN